MANHKSAEKRARQSIKRNLRNRSYLSSMKTTIKGFYLAVEELKKGQADSSKAVTLMSSAQSALHKAAAKGLLHKNNAARRVSRLTNALKLAVTAQVNNK